MSLFDIIMEENKLLDLSNNEKNIIGSNNSS